MLVLHAPVVFSQTGGQAPTSEPQTAELPKVTVVGIRSSLATAQQIKRDSVEIVDSIVADDISRLPDFNVTDAMQRITGVQIVRDRGEGSNVSIRGLSQMETLLNGREFFTAGTGRNLNFADIPSDIVAGIDVIKTPSANHIEGGVGGSVNLRTRKPFDFRGREIVGTARIIRGDLARSTKGQVSLLASDRWTTAGSGEWGALVHLSYQDRGWREDQKGTGVPQARDQGHGNEIVPGQTVFAPSGTSETTSIGHRVRSAGSAILQWRASQALELYAEGSLVELKTIQDSHQINVTASNSFVPGSATLFPGTQDLRSITWTNSPLSVLSFARDLVDRTKLGAVGAIWSGESLTVKADLSRTTSFNSLFFSGPFFAGAAANFTHDLSNSVPATSLSGTNLLDPTNLRYTGIAFRYLPFSGSLTTARIDADQRVGGHFIDTVSAGIRLARRRALNDSGLIFADAPVAGLTAADKPGFVMPNPYNFFPGVGSSSIGGYLVGNLATARDAVALRNAFGITAPIPAEASLLSRWNVNEETQAAYAMAAFKVERWRLDGNAGLRMVRTREAVSSGQSDPSGAGVLPINVRSDYVDWLPSLNLRMRGDDGVVLRASASKTVTRPNFEQLTPSLILVPNPIDPSLNLGVAGNPDLAPIRSSNLDIAIERYFSANTSVFLTAFWKRVDGFVTNVSSPEVHGGATYQVTRPRNSAAADVRGFEVGYQQFYDKLPGWLGGLGLQVNYTYVDSETPSNELGTKVPLQNLSRHSVNLIGMYERGPWSARVAYNWRDKFLSGITNVVGVGALPAYTEGYGWLDASLRLRLSDRVSLAVEGTNLLRTMRRSYYGVPTRPQANLLNDRQFDATLTVRF